MGGALQRAETNEIRLRTERMHENDFSDWRTAVFGKRIATLPGADFARQFNLPLLGIQSFHGGHDGRL